MKQCCTLKINEDKLLALYQYLKAFNRAFLPTLTLKKIFVIEYDKSSIMIEDLHLHILLDHLRPGKCFFTAALYAVFLKKKGYKELNVSSTLQNTLKIKQYKEKILLNSPEIDLDLGYKHFKSLFKSFFTELESLIASLDNSFTVTISFKLPEESKTNRYNSIIKQTEKILKVPTALKKVYKRGQTIKYCPKTELKIQKPSSFKKEHTLNLKKAPTALQRVLKNVQ